MRGGPSCPFRVTMGALRHMPTNLPDYRDNGRLTLAAKGLYAVVLKLASEKKNDVKLSDIRRLAAEHNPSNIKKAIDELEKAGYLAKLDPSSGISIDGTFYGLPKS